MKKVRDEKTTIIATGPLIWTVYNPSVYTLIPRLNYIMEWRS